jgi:hypothetical protein
MRSTAIVISSTWTVFRVGLALSTLKTFRQSVAAAFVSR